MTNIGGDTMGVFASLKVFASVIFGAGLLTGSFQKDWQLIAAGVLALFLLAFDTAHGGNSISLLLGMAGILWFVIRLIYVFTLRDHESGCS